MRGNGSNGRTRLAATAVRVQPDSRLVGLVREGHALAFEEIVRRYRSPLVSFAGAIVPRDRAEDVVQEALAKAHDALGRGDGGINLRPWLYTIVRNRALNTLRDEPTYEHLDENFDGVPQPPDVAAQREELAALIAGLRGLPEPQREALVGRELEGRSHDEIAGSLGTTPTAVRGLIYRARTALRDGLGLLIPLPVLRAVLGWGPAGSDAAGAGGAVAAGLASGGGGVALKAGATLGVAAIAVGSGFAIQHRGSGSDETHAAGAHARPGVVARTTRSGTGPVDGGHLLAETHSGRGSSGPGSDRSGESGEGGGSSGPGSSGDGSSGEGSSGSDDGGQSGSSGTGGGGDSGTGGGGSSGTGDGGGSGTSGSGDDGSGTSGSGSGSGEMAATSEDDGSGDLTTTTTTTTTSTTSDGGGGGGGSSGPG